MCLYLLWKVEDEMRMIFVAVNFSLETTQAERVTMEEVAKAKASAGVSAADVHMNSVRYLKGLRRVRNWHRNHERETKKGPERKRHYAYAWR
jgi:hypothetical protein